jgi:hypothetical protein
MEPFVGYVESRKSAFREEKRTALASLGRSSGDLGGHDTRMLAGVLT